MLYCICFDFLMSIHMEDECCMTQTKGTTTVFEAQQCTFWTLVIETSLSVDNAWLCLQLDHGKTHPSSRSFVQGDANNTETVVFSKVFAIVLYGHKAAECNMTWPIAHEFNHCIFWTSCTGVSWRHPFLFIMLNIGFSWHTDIQILVAPVLHTRTEITLKMSYICCFWFSLCQGYMVNKRRHYNAEGTPLHMFHGHYSTRDWVEHILDKSNFCVNKFVSCA